MPDNNTPVTLIVLDGWGYRAETEGNAIALANTPAWDKLWDGGGRETKTLLEASGLRVGLPAGQMGNSEVGHLNLGAGRVVVQDLVRISASIADGSFYNNPALVGACRHAKQNNGTLHLIGLVGNGGVHALDQHMFAIIELAKREGLAGKVAIHAMMDGRDAPPTSGLGFVRDLLAHAQGVAKIASVSGRYYSMDRDNRWQRTELFYRAAVQGVGPRATDPLAAIQASYDAGLTDEFMLPVVIVDENDNPVAPMHDGDAVIGANYRSDRMRQIIRTLIDPGFDGFDISGRPKLHVCTLTQYDKNFGVPVAFAPFSMDRILAQVLSESGKSMLKTAETEKYPHVTYFFNGGIEAPFKCEDRILIPSQKVATYDLMPEMSAPGICDTLVKAIESKSHDFMLCNFANADMVGHSGSLAATIKAVETVDACLARIVAAADKAGTRLIITADHGNAEMMIDPVTGGVHTAHTTNPVPIVVANSDGSKPLRSGGALCDVGPTILSMMGLPQPPEMTGVNLM